MDFTYPFLLEERTDNIIMKFPDFPEIVAEVSFEECKNGRTKAIALETLKHAIQARIDYHDIVPVAVEIENSDGEIALPPMTSAKVKLYSEVQQRGWSKSSFAKKIGITPTDASRLLDVFHESRTDILMMAFDGLGLVLHTEFSISKAASV